MSRAILAALAVWPAAAFAHEGPHLHPHGAGSGIGVMLAAAAAAVALLLLRRR